MFEHFNIKSMLGFEKKTKIPKDPNVKILLGRPLFREISISLSSLFPL